jgi:hypothetical protein
VAEILKYVLVYAEGCVVEEGVVIYASGHSDGVVDQLVELVVVIRSQTCDLQVALLPK